MSEQPAPKNLDPVLDEDAALALVRRHVPAAKHLVAVDESGRKGRAYFVDDDVVLKTHRPVRLRARLVEEFETSLEKEAFFLRHMAADDRLKAPKLLGYGRGHGVEYVCMTRIQGVSLRRANLTAQQRAAVLQELGLMLRRMHAFPQGPFVASHLFPSDGSSQELRRRLESLVAHMTSAIHELPSEWRIRLPPEQVASEVLNALPDQPVRAALHSNPAGEHVFVHPETGTFAGLIDFGDAYISHPALDLRPWRDPVDRSALIEGYSIEGNVDASFLTMWRIGLLLGVLAEVLRRREPPKRSEETLRQLLTELRQG